MAERAPIVNGTDPAAFRLPAEPGTVHWGYFDQDLEPVLTVPSGAIISVEAITHHAGDAPDLLMDEPISRLFEKVTDRGPGPHILTGPIAVRGARPGDVLEVRILSLEPRIDFGSNLAAHWGHLYGDFGKERVTVWSIDRQLMTAQAIFAYDWKTTPLANSPGTLVPPGSVTRKAALADVVVPLRPHLGTMGVAPATPGRHSSVPPGVHGGNVDNWRAGPGTSMHYPVARPGALLSLGDPHLSQGDGEISGTALEASLDVVIQVRIRRDLPFDVPVLETPTHWYVHGFGDNLDEAMADAARGQLRFLNRLFGLSADDAYSLTSVGGDFAVTQVVDQRQGVHAGIAKSIVAGRP
ncbi:MAG TPA: acetamidase/formamidase family protein [Acidimicrobiales bacterium]|nr:acetamidase/formamidase family protein [Acidimicrobiales bacterium]